MKEIKLTQGKVTFVDDWDYFGEFARLNVVNSPINREELLEKLIKMEGEGDGKTTTIE